MKSVDWCPACGARDFSFREVLWPELVRDWQLSSVEADYINRQQGFYCKNCGNNLRSMALADGIRHAYHFSGSLVQFVESDVARALHVLEVNKSGELSPIFAKLPHYQLACHPECDMADLSFDSRIFDLVIHSDTLEHVPNPVGGLAECRRVLKSSGRCIFTVPLIIGRLTRSRAGLKNSFHGTQAESGIDHIVHTEFGADIWRLALEAGFGSVRINCLEYPCALAIEAAIIN